MKSYDVSFKKTRGEKSHFVKIGIAFLETKTGRINLIVDAVPLADWDGRLTLFPHTEKNSKTEAAGEPG